MPKDMRDHEFEQFAVARTAHLYRSAWLLCGDAHGAEDLVQETLAKVYVRMTRRIGASVDNPAAYAQTTLVRTFISETRRRSRTEQPRAELPDVATADGLDLIGVRLALASALGQLEPLDRAVLVLRYLDDVSAADVAKQLGLSSGAVRNRSMRALSRVRDLLGPSLTDLVTP